MGQAEDRCLIFEARKHLKAPEVGKGCKKQEILLLTSKRLTSTRGCSSAGRAPALQAGGHRFEPVHLHQLSF